MICKNCGMDNADNVQYCSNCGTSVNQSPAPTYSANTQNAGPTYVNVQVPSDTDNYVSVGGYVGMLLAECVPILNIVMMIIWGTSRNKSKKNFVLAQLLIMAIVLGVSILLTLLSLLLGFGCVAMLSDPELQQQLQTMVFSMF